MGTHGQSRFSLSCFHALGRCFTPRRMIAVTLNRGLHCLNVTDQARIRARTSTLVLASVPDTRRHCLSVRQSCPIVWSPCACESDDSYGVSSYVFVRKLMRGLSATCVSQCLAPKRHRRPSLWTFKISTFNNSRTLRYPFRIRPYLIIRYIIQ